MYLYIFIYTVYYIYIYIVICPLVIHVPAVCTPHVPVPSAYLALYRLRIKDSGGCDRTDQKEPYQRQGRLG